MGKGCYLQRLPGDPKARLSPTYHLGEEEREKAASSQVMENPGSRTTMHPIQSGEPMKGCLVEKFQGYVLIINYSTVTLA